MRKPVTILVADDDPDDRMLIARALERSMFADEIRMVEDGEVLLDYLYRRGAFGRPNAAPRPGLVLLDLNMPRLSGREALRFIKRDPSLRSIPVIVLTTSEAESDVLESYDTGANAFVTKPVSFGDLVRVARVIDSFWFQTVTLPGR